jgi:hypothetical protein
MDIKELKGYGLAVSDLEGNWSPEFKARIKKKSQKIILNHLSFAQKIKLIYYFLKEKQRASRLDLSDLHTKGMTNASFIQQQLEYLAMFSALSKTLDTKSALAIMFEVMEATAGEAMRQNTPTLEEIKSCGDTMETFRKYFEPLPEASCKAGCHKLVVTENTARVFQLDITYCVWLELARKMSIPEACLPNCYADDFAYPEYYNQLGIKYSRKGTLAQGCKSCDLRFEKM